MKVYVVYKFDNESEVNRVINIITSEVHQDKKNEEIYFFKFEKNDRSKKWHSLAKVKMKEANLVLFFDSIEDNKDKLPKIDKIKWELELADKLKKKVVVVKGNDSNYSKRIYNYDYTEKVVNSYKYRVFNEKDVINYLISEANWNMNTCLIQKEEDVFKDLPNEDSKKYFEILMQQYKIMIETSEKLMERRLSTTNLYTTLCSTLLTFSTASIAFKNLLLSGVIFLISGIIIFILCSNWKNLLVSYEMNNAGKYEVINSIEKKLPANMFDCEYRYNTFNGIKSFSFREKRLPNIFKWVGVIVAILGIAIAVLYLVLEFLPVQDNNTFQTLLTILKA